MQTKFHKIQEKLSPRKIALLAVTLWLMSLVLYPALILYNGDKVFGPSLFLIGWLGPLCMQFSWYSNIFFAFGIYFQLAGNKPAVKTSILATILIADSFRYKEMLLDEGGGSSQIYGYGLGHICWVSSIFLLLLSTGCKIYQQRNNANSGILQKNHIIPIFSLPLLLYVLFVSYSSINFFINGSSHEQEIRKSNLVIYKTNKVCGLDARQPKVRFVVNRHKPLEVVTDGKNWTFKTPNQLLNWGIPKVRMNNFDYFNSYYNKTHTMAAMAKAGEASVLLTASQRKSNQNKKIITLELSSSEHKFGAFKQDWIEEIAGSSYMCPNYNTYPNTEEQPRKLIMNSLIIDRMITASENRHQYKTYSGEFLSESTHNYNTNGSLDNFDCQDNIGFVSEDYWENLTKNDPVASKLGHPFRIHETYYFPTRNLNKSLCSGKFIYLYRFGRNGKNDENLYLRISKRDRDSFGEDWFRAIRINDIGSKIIAKSPHIISIEENKRMLFIELLDSKTGQTIKIKSKLSGRKG